MDAGKGKKRKDKDQDDGFKKSSGVRYDAIMDRQVGDKRFEREKAYKATGSSSTADGPAVVSSTFDAFQRMAAGLEGRTLAEKIADPNRPTWEQYKKENEDKLDLVGNEVREMVEYRAQLDREREERLSKGLNRGKKSTAISDSDSDSSEDTRDRKRRKKDKEKDKDRKKSKRDKKDRKREKKREKEKKKGERDSSMKLSEIMAADDSS